MKFLPEDLNKGNKEPTSSPYAKLWSFTQKITKPKPYASDQQSQKKGKHVSQKEPVQVSQPHESAIQGDQSSEWSSIESQDDQYVECEDRIIDGVPTKRKFVWKSKLIPQSKIGRAPHKVIKYKKYIGQKNTITRKTAPVTTGLKETDQKSTIRFPARKNAPVVTGLRTQKIARKSAPRPSMDIESDSDSDFDSDTPRKYNQIVYDEHRRPVNIVYDIVSKTKNPRLCSNIPSTNEYVCVNIRGAHEYMCAYSNIDDYLQKRNMKPLTYQPKDSDKMQKRCSFSLIEQRWKHATAENKQLIEFIKSATFYDLPNPWSHIIHGKQPAKLPTVKNGPNIFRFLEKHLHQKLILRVACLKFVDAAWITNLITQYQSYFCSWGPSSVTARFLAQTGPQFMKTQLVSSSLFRFLENSQCFTFNEANKEADIKFFDQLELRTEPLQFIIDLAKMKLSCIKWVE